MPNGPAATCSALGRGRTTSIRIGRGSCGETSSNSWGKGPGRRTGRSRCRQWAIMRNSCWSSGAERAAPVAATSAARTCAGRRTISLGRLRPRRGHVDLLNPAEPTPRRGWLATRIPGSAENMDVTTFLIDPGRVTSASGVVLSGLAPRTSVWGETLLKARDNHPDTPPHQRTSQPYRFVNRHSSIRHLCRYESPHHADRPRIHRRSRVERSDTRPPRTFV